MMAPLIFALAGVCAALCYINDCWRGLVGAILRVLKPVIDTACVAGAFLICLYAFGEYLDIYKEWRVKAVAVARISSRWAVPVALICVKPLASILSIEVEARSLLVYWGAWAVVAWLFRVTDPLFNPTLWPGVDEEVHPEYDADEMNELCSFFDAQCQLHASSYKFGLKVKRAFRVRAPEQEKVFLKEQSCIVKQGKPSNCQRLVHGTTASSARSIIADGFRLPDHPGMFGSGIYFANCPLKSFQYCKDRHCNMLICDVELGSSRLKRTAGFSGLQRNFFQRLLGKPDYDSITAVHGQFGCVRVPEFVIYKPEQALPRYLVQVEKVARA